jgi:hypothetical protein
MAARHGLVTSGHATRTITTNGERVARPLGGQTKARV